MENVLPKFHDHRLESEAVSFHHLVMLKFNFHSNHLLQWWRLMLNQRLDCSPKVPLLHSQGDELPHLIMWLMQSEQTCCNSCNYWFIESPYSWNLCSLHCKLKPSTELPLVICEENFGDTSSDTLSDYLSHVKVINARGLIAFVVLVSHLHWSWRNSPTTKNSIKRNKQEWGWNAFTIRFVQQEVTLIPDTNRCANLNFPRLFYFDKLRLSYLFSSNE